MKRSGWTSVAIVFFALLFTAALSACKSSGMAVTERGQLLKINIESPTDLSEGETKEITVEVGSRGVNRVKNAVIEVELPAELVVITEVHGNGMTLAERVGENGIRVFQYAVGDLNTGETSTARFHVRAAFGTRARSGDIRVTAYSTDVPGNKLVETKYVKLRA